MCGLLATSCTTEGPTRPPSRAPADTSTSAEAPTASDAVGGTLRYALDDNPASIDPRFVSDQEGLTVVDALFDSLVAIGDDLTSIEPAAATDWSISDDGRTYTFELRPDATYHDGAPVVAQDFVRSFERIVDREAEPQSFLFYQLAPVRGYEAALEGEALSGVRAVDDHTLRIRLRHPAAEFLQVLAHPSLAPVPPAAEGGGGAFADEPVGNGPFEMAEAWQQNQFIRVTRFADHPTPPRLDEVVFQIFADDRARQQQYDDFQDGRVDVASVPPERLSDAVATYGRSSDGRSGPGLIDGTTGTVYYYGFNTQLAPFDDRRVRRALSLLIDRDRIVGEILLGTREPAEALVPPSLPGAQPGACDVCDHDPERARQILDREGTTEVTGPLEIVHDAGTTNERIAERVADDISSALDIEVTTREMSLADVIGELREGTIGIFRLGWQADYPSPGAVLQPLFRSDTIGQDNLTRYSRPRVDRLLDRARREQDTQARLELYQQVEQLVLEDAPVAPIFFYRSARLVSDQVRDLRIGPLGRVSLDEAWKPDES